MGKTVTTIGLTVGLAVVTGGIAGALAPAAFGATGVAAGAIAGAQMGAIGALVSSGVGLISRAFVKKPSMEMEESIGRLQLSVNPQALGKFVFGQTAFASDIVYAEQHGPNEQYVSQIIAAAAHRVESFGTLYITNETISFTGQAATGDWASTLWRESNLGTDGQTHLEGTQAFTWPSTADGRGLAHYLLQWQLGKTKTEQGLPSRITQVGKGIPVYDPRLDTSRGGSGDHRADDQSTWEYNDGSTDIGQNWALVVALYLLGWHTEDGNDNLIFGMGVDPDDIDWDSVIAAANICEETVDSLPRFKIGGMMPTHQDHENILRQFEAAIGGRVAKFGGKYFIWSPNDDLTTFSSIGEDDLVRDVGVEFTPSGPIEDLFNTCRGLYIEPDELYQAVPYPEVQESTAVTEDGRERILEHNFSIIQDVEIAERVARYLVRRSRFSATWRFAMGPKGLLFKPFDVTTLNIKETNDEDVTVRIISMTYSLSGLVVIECIEEDSSIYDTSASLGTPVTQADPGSFDPAATVAVSTLAASATSVTGSSGTATDALKVTWADPGPLVRETQVQFRKTGDSDWIDVPPARVDFTTAIITGVEPGTGYDIRARHITIFGAKGSWSSTINQTAGSNQKSAAIVNQGGLATKNTVGTPEIDNSAVTEPKVGTSAISTNKVSTNAITDDESTYTSGSIVNTTGEGYETIQSVAVPNSGDGAPFPVIINASFHLSVSAASDVNIRIRRDSTTIYGPVTVNLGGSGTPKLISINIKDDPGVTGTHTYTVEVDAVHNTATMTFRSITALGVKK